MWGALLSSRKRVKKVDASVVITYCSSTDRLIYRGGREAERLEITRKEYSCNNKTLAKLYTAISIKRKS